MLTNIFVIKLITICSVLYLVQCSQCNHSLAQLSDEQCHFIQCVTKNSVPVTMCISCKEKYEIILRTYDFLSTNCSDIYFDKDRINLIATTESVLTGLWSKAYCDDCFNNNNSEVFIDKSNIVSSCFDKHKKESCDNCKSEYLDLNSFYINLDQHNNGEVCYDLQDSMNRTREKWSKEFNCRGREQNLSLFIIVLCITSGLPLLFYGTTFYITKRHERYQRILSNEDPYYSDVPSSSTQNVINGINNQTPSIIDNIPSSSNAGTNNADTSTSLASKNKNDLFSNNDMESSDDEMQIDLTIPSVEKVKSL